jgi:hypothetical protein
MYAMTSTLDIIYMTKHVGSGNPAGDRPALSVTRGMIMSALQAAVREYYSDPVDLILPEFEVSELASLVWDHVRRGSAAEDSSEAQS